MLTFSNRLPKNIVAGENFTGPHVWSNRKTSCRMLEKADQQGRRRVETGGVPSGAHGATNKEHHVCARRRVGEAAGSRLRISMSRERSWRTFSASCEGRN